MLSRCVALRELLLLCSAASPLDWAAVGNGCTRSLHDAASCGAKVCCSAAGMAQTCPRGSQRAGAGCRAARAYVFSIAVSFCAAVCIAVRVVTSSGDCSNGLAVIIIF
jgi:hypothetical protein